MSEFEGKVVLLVEDEDSIRLTLRDYLRKHGFEVLVASDGVGAIKQLLDHHVDVIVTDYRMDVLGGDYWIKFLSTYCKEQKVVITSGFLKPEFSIPFKVIFKPFDYSRVADLINEVLTEGNGG